MKAGHMKVLAKNGLNPYFSVNCPCSQQPLTGKWFLDYFSYYPRSLAKLELNNFPTTDAIPQTYSYEYMYSNLPSWRPSAITINQPYFYRAACYFQHGLGDTRTELYYRTKELEISGNNLILQQQMYKEQSWWDRNDVGDVKFVSGNATSAIAYNYCLSTNIQNFVIDSKFITEQSGFISSIIINNVDNQMLQGDFITGYPIEQYPLTAQENYYPVVTDSQGNQYVLTNTKSYANNQYFATRLYKGTQYGYVFDATQPDLYYYNRGYQLVDDHFTMCGDDDPPVQGKVVYFQQFGTSLYFVRKIGNKYYKLNTHDYKRIEEIPSSDVVSSTIQFDTPSIVKITTGLAINGDDFYEQPLLSSSNGLMLQESNGTLYPIQEFQQSQLGEMWSNEPYYVDGSLYCYTTRINGQSGQYFVETPWIEETIDDIEYTWQVYVSFPKQYDSTTSTATMNVYKFGYYYDYDLSDYVYTSASVVSTSVFTAIVYQWYEEGEPPATHWDTQLSCFYYPSGTAANNHPQYTDLYFDVYHLTNHGNNGAYMDTQRFYIYKAPAWLGVEGFTYNGIRYYTLNSNLRGYLISGSTYDNIRVYEINNGDEIIEEITPSAGWWVQYDDISNNYICLVLSGQDYWYVQGLSSMVKGTASQLDWVDSETVIESGYYNGDVITAILNYYPLTGGTLFNQQKSIAADNPNRPPYWFFPYPTYHANILSGKYIVDPNNRIVPIVPAYYDSFFGHAINYFSIDDGVFEHWNVEGQTWDPNKTYYVAKDMINTYAYTYCNPFIKYVATEYHYTNDALGDNYTDNPTVAQFFQLYKDPDYPFSGNVVDTSFFYDPYWGVYNQQYCTSWGSEGPNDDLDYRTQTQKFVKMTAAEIEANVANQGANSVDKNLSGALALQTGIFCQILTGFWLRNNYDKRLSVDRGNICGIRKNGSFFATLNFDTEYKFGYDLSNASQLNDLLSSDNSTCFESNTNGIITSTQVSAYWAAMSANLQSSTKVQSTDFSKFYSYCYIRPISGVFGLIQP